MTDHLIGVLALGVALLVPAAPCASGQEAVDPFAGGSEQAEPEAEPAPPSILFIQAEFIAVPPESATRLLESGELADDETATRRALQRMLEQGEAVVAETIAVVTASGQRAKAESVRAVPYATEVQPARGRPSRGPGVPASLSGADLPVTTGRSTRMVGTLIEVDPVIRRDADTVGVDLNLALSMVEILPGADRVLQSIPAGAGVLPTVTVPTFFPMEVSTAISVDHGEYALVSIVDPPAPPTPPGLPPDNPRLLVFVRALVQTAERPGD